MFQADFGAHRASYSVPGFFPGEIWLERDVHSF